MVNASKILTVSYGTFSCTLEGFDDPFSTMRSIAEYFRDLAADDRYFGAEPPTPDAEMLHRIAERENQRRVEARVEGNGNGVVLRQVADQSESPAEPDAAQASTEAASDAPVEDFTELADAQSEAVADSVAAKLARIRAAVARSRTETEPLLNSVFAEDEHAEPLYEAAPIASAFNTADAADAGETLVADAGTDAELSEPDQIDESDVTGLLEHGEPDKSEAAQDHQDAEEVAVELDTADAEATEAETAEEEPEPVSIPQEALSEMATEETEAESALDEAAPEAVEDDAEAIVADLEPEVVEPEDITSEIEPDVTTPEAELETDLTDAETDSLLSDATAEILSDEGNIVEDEEPDLAAMLDVAVSEAVEETPEVDAAAELDEAPLDLSAVLGVSDETNQDIQEGAEGEDVLDADAAPVDEPLDVAAVALDDSAPVSAPEEDEAADFDMASILAEVDAVEPPAQEPQTEATEEVDSLLLTGDDRADLQSAEDDAEELDHQPEITAPRVRVMKLSREEFDAQFAEIEDEDEDEDNAAELTDEDGIREVLGDTGLSPEDEADLISELVEVEREFSGADAETANAAQDDALEHDAVEGIEDKPGTVSETLEALVAEATAGEQGDEPATKADDASVDRLLARADTALEDGEGSRRRSAIAHLKAAVAAVRADGGKVNEETQAETARTMNKFRDDLARAVRPDTETTQTPTIVSAETPPVPATEPVPVQAITPAEPPRERPRRKMPPLMLVSEQRIDKETGLAGAEPVRPRRIQTEDLDNELFGEEVATGETQDAGNFFSDASDFKGFVAETGAEGTQELLEASLAFGLNIEGAQFNSRPQIMKRMLSLFPDGSVTREDGLRAFGVLLREGRIHRFQRGQFLLPETSRFYQGEAPEANMA